MQYNQAFFDGGIDRRGTFCEKWDDPSAMPPGALPLWVADMDFPCARPIQEAILERAAHACYGYACENPADAEALCAYWRRRHGLDFAPEQTRMLPCVVTGLRACVRALTRPGEGVAIMTPVYGPFYAAVQENGRRVESVPLARDAAGRYQMDLNRLRAVFAGGTKLLMLCNPQNPVSRLWSREELTAVARLAAEFDATLVSDEIHADFVYKPLSFPSILSIPEARERAVMLCAASKTFNVAGLQQASAVSFAPALLRAMEKELGAAGVTSGNTFALAATRAAYTDCDDWLDGLLDYLDGNRAELAGLIAEYLPKAHMTPVEATYLAWLDLRAYGESSAVLAEKLKKGGVVLTEGTFFGEEEGQGFMRVNFGCPRAMLRAGVIRMAKALREDENHGSN